MTLTLDDYWMLYPSVRPPETAACFRVLGGKRPRFTTNPDQVTCSSCRKHIARDTKERWEGFRANQGSYQNWADDRELVRRAWLMCCHKQRVPGPCSERDAVDHERKLRAKRILAACDWALPLVEWRAHRREAQASSVTEAFERRMADLNAADRALLTGVLADARIADSLLAEAQKQLGTFADRVFDVARHVRSNALVALPEVN